MWTLTLMGICLFLFSFIFASCFGGLLFFSLSLSLIFLFFGVWGFMSFSFFLCYDLLGWILVEMSILIVFLLLLGGLTLLSGDLYGWGFFFFFLLLLSFLFFSFGSLSLFVLYFFFECCILPTFFVVLGWGFSEGRLQASFYFFFYTMFFSLPFLILIFLFSEEVGSLLYVFYYFFGFLSLTYFFTPFMFMIFLVKLPVFFLHVWLPKAHVEAPLPGSMVLAAVLLKLGGYGLYRVFGSFYWSFFKFFPFIYSLGLLGGILACFSCFCQVDLKRLVAFMSISHMGMMLGGLLTCSYWGFMGSIFFMVSHGLVSSGLFGGVNFLYERLHTRSIVFLRGSLEFFSSFVLFLFFLSIFNMSFPPSLGFFSEIMVSWGVLFFSSLGFAFFFFLSFLGCVCSIHFFVSLIHGSGRLIFSGISLTVLDSFFFMGHLLPLIYSLLIYS